MIEKQDDRGEMGMSLRGTFPHEDPPNSGRQCPGGTPKPPGAKIITSHPCKLCSALDGWEWDSLSVDIIDDILDEQRHNTIPALPRRGRRGAKCFETCLVEAVQLGSYDGVISAMEKQLIVCPETQLFIIRAPKSWFLCTGKKEKWGPLSRLRNKLAHPNAGGDSFAICCIDENDNPIIQGVASIDGLK